jgi:hypothetical protein
MSVNGKLNVWLGTLTSVSAAMSIVGTFTGDVAQLSGYTSIDANLFYGAPLASWQRIFKFKTDGSVNVTNEYVTLSTAIAKDIIGSSTATTSVANTSSLYQVNNTLTILSDKSNVVYTSRKVTDFSASDLYPDDPAAALNFLKLLAKAVFGSVQAVDMFSNETELATAYGLAVEALCNTCSNKFSAVTSGTANGPDTITGTDPENFQMAKQIWSYMTSIAVIKARFSMGYNAIVTTGAFTDGLGIAVKLNGVATAATVDVFMDASGNVNRIDVNTPTNASTFAKNNDITIEKSGAVITITLNSVQAAMLNGKLNQDTEFPLEVGDTFHGKFIVSNHPLQNTIGNKLIGSDSVNRVEQYVDFHIQLVA